MSTAAITLTLDEVDTIRDALITVLNKYSEWAEEAHDKGNEGLAKKFEEEADTVFNVLRKF